MSAWTAVVGVLSFMLVAAAILWSFLGDPFTSFILVYFSALSIAILLNEGHSGNYLVEYILSTIDIDTDADLEVGDEGFMISEDEKDIVKEEYQRGMNDGYPTEFLVFLLLVIFVLILADLTLHWRPPNQLYGISQSAIGSMIIVQDRLRDLDTVMSGGFGKQGRNWIEAACGFALITTGFLLQLVAALL